MSHATPPTCDCLHGRAFCLPGARAAPRHLQRAASLSGEQCLLVWQRFLVRTGAWPRHARASDLVDADAELSRTGFSPRRPVLTRAMLEWIRSPTRTGAGTDGVVCSLRVRHLLRCAHPAAAPRLVRDISSARRYPDRARRDMCQTDCLCRASWAIRLAAVARSCFNVPVALYAAIIFKLRHPSQERGAHVLFVNQYIGSNNRTLWQVEETQQSCGRMSASKAHPQGPGPLHSLPYDVGR